MMSTTHIYERHPDVTMRFQCTYPSCKHRKVESLRKAEEHVFRKHIMETLGFTEQQKKDFRYYATPYRPQVTQYLKQVPWPDPTVVKMVKAADTSVPRNLAPTTSYSEPPEQSYNSRRTTVEVQERQPTYIAPPAPVSIEAALSDEQYETHSANLKTLMRQVALVQSYYQGTVTS
eukprot:CFRG2221T1